MKIQNYVNRALLLNAAVISAAGSASAAGTQGASGIPAVRRTLRSGPM